MSSTTASNTSSGPSTYRARATSHPLVHAALARLSDKDREVLVEFRNEFPNLIPEEMAKVANSFMLYRSLYVQKAKEADPNGNQADYSRDAAVFWKYSVDDSEKDRYSEWHFRVRAVWKKMYPNGFPSSAVTKKAKDKKRQTAVRRKKAKRSTSRLSAYKKFKPLPSPPVSVDADFTSRASSEEAYEPDSMSKDDPKDSDERSLKEPSCQSSSCQSQPKASLFTSIQRMLLIHHLQPCVEPELLTPVSMVWELSPDRSALSLSPMPVVCHSDADISPEPALGDIKLSELNDNCPSTFTDSLLFSSFPLIALHPRETESFSEEFSPSYSADVGSGTWNSSLIAWDETNFLSDSEIYLSLSSFPSLSPDLLYVDSFSMPMDTVADTLAQDIWQ